MSSIRLLQPHVPVNEVATAALSFEYKAFTEANERVSFFFFFFFQSWDHSNPSSSLL